MINVELFSCAGGMAEGFRRAGVTFDMAVDFAEDHCDSYETNIGHRPIRMDARDLLRMVNLGWRAEIDLLVADPPCTPWSRAGKRLGTRDERDMLEVTCELIAEIAPRRYLISNVPGLDDRVNLPIVQRVIGGLSRFGYCTADFARLDAADYGVPQHRVRPFWFGHRDGPCIRWPAPTHGDPLDASVHSPLAGMALAPWVTCRDALGHLDPEQLGRPVKMRHRSTKHPHLAAGAPSTTIRGGGDGHAAPEVVLSFDPHHPPLFADEPAMTVRAGCGGGLTRGMSLASRHEAPVHTSTADAPARSITTQCRAQGHATTIVPNERHAPAMLSAPSPTIGAKQRGQSEVLVADRKKRPPPKAPQRDRVNALDKPATTVLTDTDRAQSSSPKLEWPWARPSTTVTSRPGLPPPGHHDEDFAIMSLPDAILLGELAATILQGFPEGWVFAGKTKKARWSQIGQAMPPPLAEAVARAVVEQDEATKRGAR